MQLSARLHALDLTKLLIYTVIGAPPTILPYLIWQFDMSIPAPAMEYFGITEQSIIQNALMQHQYLGAVQNLLDVLTMCGYGGSTVQEGQASWGGVSYPASQGWAVFRVTLTSGTASPTDIAKLTQIINFFKPARCLLDAIVVSSGFLFADGETPAGTMNGSNRVFTLAHTPIPPNMLKLYYNGLLMFQGTDYTISGNTITLAIAPGVSDVLDAYYMYGVFASGFWNQVPTGLVNGINTHYTLAFAPNAPTSLQLYYNGTILKYGVDFTLASNVITMTFAPTPGDILDCFYRYGAIPALPHYGDNIVPTGTINGTNKIFTVVNAPTPALSLQWFLNGLLIKQGVDYTVSGSTITYTTAPLTGDTHAAYYRY